MKGMDFNMEKEKINYSLIEEPKTALPKRGGNYVSEESKKENQRKREQKRERLLARIDFLTDKLNERYDKEDDDHPFHWGEGSC